MKVYRICSFCPEAFKWPTHRINSDQKQVQCQDGRNLWVTSFLYYPLDDWDVLLIFGYVLVRFHVLDGNIDMLHAKPKIWLQINFKIFYYNSNAQFSYKILSTYGKPQSRSAHAIDFFTLALLSKTVKRLNILPVCFRLVETPNRHSEFHFSNRPEERVDSIDDALRLFVALLADASQTSI